MDFMSFTKNLVKELGDGFQLSDISNAVVKTLDGGDDEEPYREVVGLYRVIFLKYRILG